MCRWRRRRTRTLINQLHRKVDAIMATQAQLDALVSRIDTAVAGIRADIDEIKAAHPEIDLSGLEARVAGLEGLDAENPAPPAEPQ
jgi:ABC-type transporter Mla subunit MlaD